MSVGIPGVWQHDHFSKVFGSIVDVHVDMSSIILYLSYIVTLGCYCVSVCT